MKKTGYLLIICILLLTLMTGCGFAADRSVGAAGEYSIYCLDRDENCLVEDKYVASGTDTEALLRELAGQLAVVPEDVRKRECIRGFEILDMTLTGAQLTISVSGEYLDMSPTTEVLVRAAMVRTLGQIDGVDSVLIRVGDEELLDAIGIPVGIMTPAQFVDNPGNEINAYDNIELTLYYANQDGTAISKVVRDVEYNTSISVEKLVVEQLIHGVNDDEIALGLKSAVNLQTSIINVTLKDGICYVNLSNEFLTLSEGVRPEVIIYSIVDSLVELPGISKVQFSIDGNTDMTLGEKMSLSVLYERNLDIVEKK